MQTSRHAFSAFVVATVFFFYAGATLAHSESDAAESKPAASIEQTSGAELLVQGTQIGKTIFPPGDTKNGGIGQAVDGIEGSSHEMLKTHTHSHLSLFYNGRRIAIPRGIGIVQPHKVNKNFVTGGKGFYWLHTHDATGIIHVESPDGREYTLGNLFNIWGRPLDQKNVAGLKGKVQAYVDGKEFAGKVRDIILTPHTLITLYVNGKTEEPPVYSFPDGL